MRAESIGIRTIAKFAQATRACAHVLRLRGLTSWGFPNVCGDFAIARMVASHTSANLLWCVTRHAYTCWCSPSCVLHAVHGSTLGLRLPATQCACAFFPQPTWHISRCVVCIVASGRWEIALLVTARKQMTSGEILLWMTPSEAPKALQASECSELLDPTGASCWIFAQR